MTAKSRPRPEAPVPSGGDSGTPREAPETSRQDDLLDEALEETFPASDPVSVYRLA